MKCLSLSLRIALLVFALFAVVALQAAELLDLRASFPRIEPYTKSPSLAVTRNFYVPGPGTLEITTVLNPWFRNTAPVRFRSELPIDGRDEAAWAEHVPGVDRIGSQSTPERWVDGQVLTIVSTYHVSKARPKLHAGIFPSVIRYGDGSQLQLANAAQITIRWQPDSLAQTPGTPDTTGDGDLTGRWADSDGPVTIVRSGNTATGSYAYRDGRMSGNWAPPIFTGYWAQSQSDRRCEVERMGSFYWGRFVLTLNANRLAGQFGYCNDVPDKPWAWSRMK